MPLGVRSFGGCLAVAWIVAACGGQRASEARPDASAGGDKGDGGSAAISATLAALALPTREQSPPDVSNRFADDPEAAKFGRTLFFDPLFSGRLMEGDNDGSPEALGRQGETGKVACSGCHLPAGAFSDTRSLRRQISLAAGWGKRRAPSLLDVGHSKLLMWDGRHDAFYNQIFGVIESPVEMNSSRLFVAQQVFARYANAYEAIFGSLPALDDGRRFPRLTAELTGCSALDVDTRGCKGVWHGVPGDNAEYDAMTVDDQEAVTRVVVNVGKALGSYLRNLSCGASRFDRWVHGEDPALLTPEEQRGAELFVGKAKCVTCHSGPYFSDEQFHNVGLKPSVVATVFIDLDDPGASAGLLSAQQDPLNIQGRFSDGDDGRLPTILAANLQGAFRTPKLRCMSKRPSFMHTGQLRTVADVVSFFSRGGDQAGFLGTSELAALELSTDERSDLVAFLMSLEGPGPSAEWLAP